MAKIPTITRKVQARQTRFSSGLVGTRATGDDFGAATGRGLQSAAKGLGHIASATDAYFTNKANSTVANAVAQADFTPRELEVRNEVPADGEGYRERVLEEYGAFVDTEADKITDDRARKAFREKMGARTPAVSRRSAVYEAGIAARQSKNEADASLASLESKILSDPSDYDEFIEQGLAVIDTREDVTHLLKAEMKRVWRQNSAKSRFTGMLNSAKTVDNLDAMALELVGKSGDKDWSKAFAPQDYERMVNLIGSTRKAMVRRTDAQARAAIDTLEARAKDVSVVIPREELARVQSTVKLSQNPATLSRMARIQRDQELLGEMRNETPTEIQAQINAARGGPGLSYPGVPPVLSSAINDASAKFGVSASYLGATAIREYGSHLRVKRPKVSAKFRPTVSEGVDLRNLRSDVSHAVSVAGEAFGASLRVVASGSDSGGAEGRGTGVSVSTVGMSDEDRARLTGSLVDAGFTGVGEFDGRLRADFRTKVPDSFGERDGQAWGGWTHLSPAVAKVLADRGFKSGAASSALKRAKKGKPSRSVDFGRGTGILDANGRPTSSAVGVFQFTKGTFLEVMRNPAVAAQTGLDVKKMTDAQLLTYRKDPKISTFAAAAYAKRNQQTLRRALGRDVDDAELYMAHFLGPGGAIALLSALKKQPNQSATALLPKAAKANRPVFYRKGKQLTVGEVYNRISRQFYTAPSRVTHGDNATRQRFVKHAKAQLKSDPMAFARGNGTFNVTDISEEGGLAARGDEARSIAEFYSIPAEDMKPFTEQEVGYLSTRLKDGDVDEVLSLMGEVQAMGGDMARAAFRQLGEKDRVYTFAAGLQHEAGGALAASEVIRGQKRLEENPAIKDSIGASGRELSDAFVQVTQGALMGADPSQRQAIQDAAIAHYIETAVARGVSEFDSDKFGESVQAVLGGVKGAPAVAEVNGHPVVLPKGVSADQLETAFNKMDAADWSAMSEAGLPPRYANGQLIDPDDLADEGAMQALGGGAYKVFMPDGSFAVTGERARNGRLKAFIFTPTEKRISQLNARTEEDAPRPRSGRLSDILRFN